MAEGGPAFSLFGIPVEFVIFAATLVGVALLHKRAFTVAVAGLAMVVAYGVTTLGAPAGLTQLAQHFGHEWVVLANLMLLLIGFAVLANQFETSQLPDLAPAVLPNGWTGGLALLVMVAVGSIFLDNIAGAMIGGVIARHVYGGRVRIGYLAAIVAAANAGGAGSVVGDTTTTMMWIAGVSPLKVLDAFVGAGVAILALGIPAALAQHKHQPIERNPHGPVSVDWTRVGIVGVMLAAILLTNAVGNALAPQLESIIPALGLALWVAILAPPRYASPTGVRQPAL